MFHPPQDSLLPDAVMRADCVWNAENTVQTLGAFVLTFVHSLETAPVRPDLMSMQKISASPVVSANGF
jgi:hypothetical protein